ncbi:hypothetical protein V8C42DRAFT_361317 [Trichoderma barbatum]
MEIVTSPVRPGQTCGNNQCVGGTTSSTMQSSISSISIPPVTIPTTTRKSTTISSSVASSSSTSQATPTVVPSVGLYRNTGCFVDSATARVLSDKNSTDLSPTGMTVEKCIALAQQGSYTYAGVEYGGECHMGNTLHNAAAAAQNDCSTLCVGNPKELCGAGNRIQIYQKDLFVVPSVGSYINQGCFVDSTTQRVLNEKNTTDKTGMTVEKCVAFALQGSYTYAGVEYSSECHVGNSLVKPSNASQTDCNQVCAGNSTEACGAGNRIQIYKDNVVAVPSVGAYKNTGCFVDSSTARVLVAANSTDHSATGMTVEKCIAFAQDGGWKYAGVEYGGECHVGNTLHNPSPAAASECNQRCAGNQGEFCGAGNRIQVYTDSSWSFPSQDDITHALITFNSTLYDVVVSTKDYQDDLEQLKKDQSDTLGDFETFLDKVKTDGDKLVTRTKKLKTEQDNIKKVFRRAMAEDVTNQNPLLTDTDQDELDDAVQKGSDVLTDLGNLVESVTEDIISDVWRTTDLVEGLAVIDATVEVVGAPVIVGGGGTVTGIFAIIYLLLKVGSEDPPPPKTTVTPTVTTTTISSTTSSSATATATEYVVLTEIGTSVVAFNDFVASLGLKEETSRTVVYPGVELQMLVASLNATQIEKVRLNPIVGAASENLLMETEEADPPAAAFNSTKVVDVPKNLTTSPGTRRARELMKRLHKKQELDSHRAMDTANSTEIQEGLTSRDSTGRIFKRDLISQPNSPNHLKLLSRPWPLADGGQDQNKDYTYDNEAAGYGITVYVIDGGIKLTHQEFVGRNIRYFIPTGAGPSIIDQEHGTEMTSLVLGETVGVAKSANAVMVKDHQDGGDRSHPKDYLATIMNGMMWIVADAKTRGIGTSVINYSQRGGDFTDGVKDMWSKVLKLAAKNDIVFVTSAGNVRKDFATDPLKTQGGRESDMIIVSGCDNDGNIPSWVPIDKRVTLYAQAVGVKEADHVFDDVTYNEHGSGTSEASAIVAGLAAYFLSKPELAGTLKVPGEVGKRVRAYIWATAAIRAYNGNDIACNGETFTADERKLRDEFFEDALENGI